MAKSMSYRRIRPIDAAGTGPVTLRAGPLNHDPRWEPHQNHGANPAPSLQDFAGWANSSIDVPDRAIMSERRTVRGMEPPAQETQPVGPDRRGLRIRRAAHPGPTFEPSPADWKDYER
jgi:hypothetical protein